MKFVKRNPVAAASASVDADFGLATALLEYSNALENLHQAEIISAEADTVINDIDQALTSIRKFGIQGGNMSVFDAHGELSSAIGREPLNLATLESMSVADLDLLKTEYIDGLVACEGNAWDGFKAAVEKIWKAIVDWFKRIFSRNEKYKQFLTANKGAFKTASASFKDQKANLLKYEDASKLTKALKNIEGLLNDVATVAEKSKNEESFGDELLSIMSRYTALEEFGVKKGPDGVTVDEFPFKETEGTLGELGYDPQKGELLTNAVLPILESKSFKRLSHAVDKAYADLIKEAGTISDASKAQAKKDKKRDIDVCNKVVKFANTVTTKLAFAAYTCCKACKAPAKAEGDKK